MSDFEQQRSNMVESQVRPSDITDRRIFTAMLSVPRERFVPGEARPIAYGDGEVLIEPAGTEGKARYLLAPRLLAQLLQALDLSLDGSALVLDVGCGSGYSAALLAQIAQTVVALESNSTLADRASKLFEELVIDNVAVVGGALTEGYPSEGPYDAILIAGGVSDVPAVILDQLKDGGRLATVLTDDGVGRVVQFQRHGGQFNQRVLGEAGTPGLPGFERAPAFVF